MREALPPLSDLLREEAHRALEGIRRLRAGGRPAVEAWIRQHPTERARQMADSRVKAALMRYRVRTRAALIWASLDNSLLWTEDRYARFVEVADEEAGGTRFSALADLTRHHLQARSDFVAQKAVEKALDAQDEHRRIQALLAEEEILAMLEAYRVRHGSYPVRLGDLSTMDGAEIPVDPWTGRPPRYALNQDEPTITWGP